MKLPYGLWNGNFIHISELSACHTEVFCPFCGSPLIAKKGKIKRHHFAHKGASCIESFSNNLFGVQGSLPLQLPLSIYAKRKTLEICKTRDDLTLLHRTLLEKKETQKTLIAELQQKLEQLVTSYTDKQVYLKAAQVKELLVQIARFLTQKIAKFPEFQLLQDASLDESYTDGNGSYIASLNQEENEYYYPVSFDKYVQCFKERYQTNTDFVAVDKKISLFQKELTYFKQFNLYLIAITTEAGIIHKIGLTSRSIELRLSEIAQDMSGHFKIVALKVLFLKKGVAFLETFFKQKYVAYQIPIGQLTEYFQFPEHTLFVLLKDFECISVTTMPSRASNIWIYWAYFNSNGKMYGSYPKSIYVGEEKFLLSKKEEEIVLFLKS